jgi:NADPH2:quinone reductase
MGSHVEYVAVPWADVVPVPDSVSLATAAAIHAGGLTALTFLTEAYAVKRGDTILIHTVAGGFGLLSTQIAKSRGATVIGTTSSDEKAAVAKAAGADHVINYKTEDTVKRVLEITGGKGVEAVFDGVGKDTFVVVTLSRWNGD